MSPSDPLVTHRKTIYIYIYGHLYHYGKNECVETEITVIVAWVQSAWASRSYWYKLS